MTIQDFLKNRPHLFWYTRNFRHLSKEAVLEAVLNYGDFEDVKKIIAMLGRKKAARIFKEQLRHRRTNYDKKISNYFRIYFKKYA